MKTSTIPPYLNYAFHHVTDSKVASEKVHKDLETISRARFLKVTEEGEINEISFIEWIWERLKGLCGYIDHSDPIAIRLRVLKKLGDSATHGFINEDDCSGPRSLITMIAKNMGLMSDEFYRARDLDELDGLINAIVLKTLKPEIPEPDYEFYIKKYQEKHIQDLVPCSFIGRLYLHPCQELLTDDEVLAANRKNALDSLTEKPYPTAPLLVNHPPIIYENNSQHQAQETSSWTTVMGVGFLGAAILGWAGYRYGVDSLKQFSFLKQPTPPIIPAKPTSSQIIESNYFGTIGLVSIVAITAFSISAVIYLKADSIKKKLSNASSLAHSLSSSTLSGGASLSSSFLSSTKSIRSRSIIKGKDLLTRVKLISKQRLERGKKFFGRVYTKLSEFVSQSAAVPSGLKSSLSRSEILAPKTPDKGNTGDKNKPSRKPQQRINEGSGTLSGTRKAKSDEPQTKTSEAIRFSPPQKRISLGSAPSSPKHKRKKRVTTEETRRGIRTRKNHSYNIGDLFKREKHKREETGTLPSREELHRVTDLQTKEETPGQPSITPISTTGTTSTIQTNPPESHDNNPVPRPVENLPLPKATSPSLLAVTIPTIPQAVSGSVNISGEWHFVPTPTQNQPSSNTDTKDRADINPPKSSDNDDDDWVQMPGLEEDESGKSPKKNRVVTPKGTTTADFEIAVDTPDLTRRVRKAQDKIQSPQHSETTTPYASGIKGNSPDTRVISSGVPYAQSGFGPPTITTSTGEAYCSPDKPKKLVSTTSSPNGKQKPET